MNDVGSMITVVRCVSFMITKQMNTILEEYEQHISTSISLSYDPYFLSQHFAHQGSSLRHKLHRSVREGYLLPSFRLELPTILLYYPLMQLLNILSRSSKQLD